MQEYGFDIAIEAADILEVPRNWEIGAPLRLQYDILITTPAGDENAWFEGDMILRDGVTRALSQDDRSAMYEAAFAFEADGVVT
ncbi:hypothetical protein SPHINGO391_450142 [Sphingomonas aurantiaca]|uniref:Uncharacterized protein n=2 Tax=Sphingomonas aurantiaca TaxID=185949 RepID=A0A5E7ZGH0_9SPHN|nr:hypothetical protein SPHINGO391_450142 [Sphingomonas aurantiaca]